MKKIFRFLNIEPEEQASVVILILQSIFLGIFYGLFDISVHTLFLGAFEEADIAKAYTLSGFLGIVMTAIYSKFQSNFSFARVSVFSLFTLVVITFFMWLSFKIWNTKELIFIAFLFLGPLNIVALVNFWGVVGRVFTLRQGKRLFGIIGSGQIFGIILASYVIPVFGALDIRVSTVNLILGSAISLLVAALVQIRISTDFDLGGASKPVAKGASNVQSYKEEHYSWRTLLADSYIRTMAIFVALSMVVLFFVSYSFLAVAKEQYQTEDELKSFLGLFMGTVMIVGFLLKTFAYSKLMKNYGLKINLLILPVLLVLISVLTIMVDTFAANAIALVFLLMSLSRLFSMALRDAIEIPAFKTLYQSLRAEIRHNVQSKIDGTVNELAALGSGLLLLGLGMIFEFMQMVWVLVLITILWGYVAIKLYGEYRRSLEDALSEFESQSTQGKVYFNFLSLLKIERVLSLGNQERKNARHLLKYLNPVDYDELMKKPESREFMATDSQTILTLARSKKLQDRKKAAISIRRNISDKNWPALLILMRDAIPDVRTEAFKSAIYYPRQEVVQILFDFITHPVFGSVAFNALIKLGEQSVPYLSQAFMKTTIDSKIQMKIIWILGEIGNQKAINFLADKLNHPVYTLVKEAIKALAANNYNAQSIELQAVFQNLEKHLGVMAWNIYAIQRLRGDKMPKPLLDAFQSELRENYEFLYKILSLAYHNNSVMQVKANIEMGTSESLGYALELLDIFVDEQIKNMLFAVLDEALPEEKLINMQEHFAISLVEEPNVLKGIIQRDGNYLTRYTRSLAMNYINQFVGLYDMKLVMAQLFHPDKLFREMAIMLTLKIEPHLLEIYRQRLSPPERSELTKLLNMLTEEELHAVFYRMQYLRKLPVFNILDNNNLLLLAQDMLYLRGRQKPVVAYNRQDLPPLIILIRGSAFVKIDTIEQEIFAPAPIWTIEQPELDKLSVHFSAQAEYFLLNPDSLKHLCFLSAPIQKFAIEFSTQNTELAHA